MIYLNRNMCSNFTWIYMNLCELMWIYVDLHEFIVWIVQLSGSAAVCGSARQCKRQIAAVRLVVYSSAGGSVRLSGSAAVCDSTAMCCINSHETMWMYICKNEFIWIYVNIHVNSYAFVVWIVRLSGSVAVCGNAAVCGSAAVRQCGSARHCERQFVAVCTVVCVVRGIVCRSALTSLWQCTRQCAAVRQCGSFLQSGSVRQCEWQCVCGSTHDNVRAVRTAVCGSALGSSIWQCARQCAAVRQCGSVRHCASVRVAVCGSARGSMRRCVAMRGSAHVVWVYANLYELIYFYVKAYECILRMN
jgi:hypothetical protein